jgi:hypothetical protein
MPCRIIYELIGYAKKMSETDESRRPVRYERPDYLSPDKIISAVIVFALFCLFMPFLAIFIPVAIPILVVLYLMSDRTENRVKAAAKKRLHGNESKLEVQVGSLVLNDWGVFYGQASKSVTEMSWDEIQSAKEPEIGIVVLRSIKGATIRADLKQDRYFEVIWAVHSKIPNRCQFLIDPVSGEMTLLAQLRSNPIEFTGKWGHLNFTDQHLEHNGQIVLWSAVDSVSENYVSGDQNETNPYWVLTIRSPRCSFELSSASFCDGPMLWETDYDLIKSVIYQKIPDRISYHRRIPTGRRRAKKEFERCYDVIKVAFTFALKTGKFNRPEQYFRHMTALVDKFNLEGAVDARTLFQDYAELLDRTNRHEEAEVMNARAKAAPEPTPEMQSGWRC